MKPGPIFGLERLLADPDLRRDLRGRRVALLAHPASVTGDLTLHGVTKAVTLQATFKGAGVNPLSKGYTVGFDVRGRLKRSDFGVKTYVPLIGDDVDLIISAPFEKK